jgi:hypothetical protein
LQSKLVSLVSDPQSGGPDLCTYDPHWQGAPVIPPGTDFPFHCLLRFTGLRWRYSNPSSHGTRDEIIRIDSANICYYLVKINVIVPSISAFQDVEY